MLIETALLITDYISLIHPDVVIPNPFSNLNHLISKIL